MKKNRLRLATSPIAGLTTADMLQEAERQVVGRIFKDMANGKIYRARRRLERGSVTRETHADKV